MYQRRKFQFMATSLALFVIVAEHLAGIQSSQLHHLFTGLCTCEEVGATMYCMWVLYVL